MKKREAPSLARPGPTPEQWRSCGPWSGRQVFQPLELKAHRDGRNRCRDAEQGSGGRFPNGAEGALPGGQPARATRWRLTPLMVSARRWVAEIEQQAIEVAGHNRKGLTWQINRLLACPIKSILALDAKTNEFHREPDFLGQGITVKAQLTNIAAECQCLSAEPVPLLVKRLIGCRSSGCHGNTFL